MSEKPVTFTKDGIVVYPLADSEESGSIRIPQTDTSLGAGFGDPITPQDLEFASTREPVAGFLIYGIAADITEKWFTVNKTETEGKDPDFDAQVQKALQALNFKKTLRQLIEYERLYGKALLVGGFDDAQDMAALKKERRRGAEPKQLVAYPLHKYSILSYDTDPSSLRFGYPQFYTVNAFGGKTFTIHWSRCFECQTRTNGASILELIWDDLTCGRNIRWGVAQWIFRTGGGFAVIQFPKETNGVPTTREQLQSWANSKEWSDITHRNYICIIKDVMDFDFRGTQGATLNPEPFFDTNTKQIAKATGIPKSILEGAEAGALTGSELNNQQYYKKISGWQTDYEEPIRWVIDACMDAGLVSGVKTLADEPKPAGSILKRMLQKVIVKDAQPANPVDYVIEWVSAFELNALDEARIDVMVEQANTARLEYMTIDEVRDKTKLKPLPNGEGAKLKTATPQQTPFGFGDQLPETNSPPHPQPRQSFDAILTDYAQKVMKGEITKQKAMEEGAVIIENYNKFESEQAKNWIRTRTKFEGEPVLTQEMIEELDTQKQRYLKNYFTILEAAEKHYKKKQSETP
jgi:hypothetical protein